MTLRWFHMVFLLIVMIGADMFGAYAFYHYGRGGEPMILALGAAGLVAGLGLAAYVAWLVKKLDVAGIH